MSIKKNIGVLVLLLVLLSMSAVSAEDVSINANDTYQTPNEIQKDFTSLQTDIDNSQGAFELTYDVKHGDDEIDNYGISITKTTIINGNGHTIDANGHGSIFVVKDSSVTLTLNDLTLINANPVSDSSGIVSNGGAVYFDGSTLIVNNVNFKNNMVYKYGGAIYTTGTCIVDSSVFDGNDVQFRSQNIDNGGAAIYADNGASLLISNSQIINNHKNMVIRDNNVGDLVDGVVVATGYTKISKSYFRNNSGCYGGAVTSLGYTNAGKNQIIIENSVFDANRAFQGAAVNVMGSTFKISGTNFTNNKGVGYGSGNPNVGALLTWYGCEGTISDCNFINNTADNGAAYRLGDDNKGVSSASVDSCTFINNTASNQGGAVYEGGTTGKATLDIKNSTFTNNSAKKEGSAIYSGYTLNIDDDTTFTNNMVYMYYTGTLNIGEIKTFTDLQKAINMVEGDIYLSSNVTMLASEADNFVNGIVVDHLVNLKCDGFTINANNLGRIFNVTSTADKLNIYNANLINGNADIGGAIYNTGSVYAYNTNFINNTAATMGGAVFNNGTLTIQKCIVDNNDITKRTSSDSEDYGGAAIYNWYDSTLFIKNSTISNNLKNYKNGDYVVGAVTSLGKTIISQNSYFVNNSGRWGGAITTSGSSLPGKKVNELSISDSTFSKNGGLYGAGIFIQGSKFSITSCVFDSNTASGKGNMTPNDNNGAAIEVTNTDKAITGTIYKSTFTNNKAQYGGAIDICAGTIKITNSKFINNSADVEGGAIDINALNGNPKVTISGSKFINNSAPLGGAILNIKDLTVKGSTFINNTPNTIFNWVGDGGNLNLNIRTFTDLQNAIGLVTGTLTLNQNVAMTAKEAADFTNGITINKDITIDGKGHTIDAKNLGRIFSIGEGFTVTLTNATLINGKATEGGAIYNDGSLTLSDVKLSDNAADSYGGAVFNNGELVVSDSVFDSNDIVNRGSAGVDYGGAAIYNWENAKLDISKSNFTNNIKNYVNGDRLVGAVTTIGNATISDSYFVNNSGRWGGALAATGGVSGSAINTIDVDGTKFVNNTALYGGAMFVWASNYTISNSVFDNNSAFGKGDMSPNNNNGGALVVTQDNIPVSGKIVNSNFTNNKAQYGGAAWINEGTVDIDGSNFINNTATAEAGAIGFDSQYIKIIATVDGSKFVNNTAGSRAGAIYNLGDLTITCSEFDNNKAQFGDIIYNNNLGNKEGILSINGNKYSNFTENKAPIINIGDINTISSTGGIIVTVLDNKTVNVCYGDVVTLHATVVADGVLVAGQKLFFVIDNVEYIANSLGNGSYIASYEVKDVGSKTVGIVYDGSDVNIKTGMLNISKATPDLTVGALNITVGDLEIITVTGPKDATGLITLTLNGIDYILPIYNGEAKFYFQDLAYGTYDVSASYSGDNHYVAAENSTVFKVDKVLANLKINVEDITFGENGLVIITLPSDIDGSIVTVNVNGKVYPVDIENGFGKLPLRELDAGDYTISAVFAGNDKYLPGVSNALLTVSKADPALNVLISDVGYDGVFNINVALTGVDAIGLNGNVIVTVNNKDYSVNIVNGKGTAVGVKLAAGTYDFTAAWAGNDNYNAVGDSGKFSVAKVDSIIDVAVSDIKVGEDAVISVKLLSDATGSVTVTVNGKDYTETVVNGVANVKVADLKAGTYDVAVKYSGDNNYNAAVATSSFTVSKVDSTMDVTVNDIVFGGDLIVDAVLPVDATGEVVITVNGVDYHVSIENGKATGTISGLAAGDYTVAIKYVGDDKYTGVEVAENVNVAKAQPVLGVVIADVDYGNGFVIEATLTGVNSAPLNGNVIVTVNGKEYTVKVTDGKGIATGDKLAAGTYAFAAAWAGDDNYNIVTENGDFKVNKVDSAIDVAVSDIKVGEDAVISVKLASDATGEVVITVNGEDYTAAIENGVASVTVSDLKAGDYTVAVKYTGDNNYNEATGSAEFSVLKITPEMDVTVEDIVFGEDLIVNAVLPVDATGEVVITVNGVDYHVAIENGVASVTVSGLEAGDYTVAVKYAGDDNYNAAEVTKGVNVAKANPALNVIIDSVDYGNVFTINAVLTGVNNAPLDTNIIVTVNGKNYIVAIVNGKGTFHADKLAAGSYNFNARFAGSNNYNEVSDSGKFNVYKVDSAIGITVKDINVGEDAVITVKLFSDATGELTVTVNGKDYTANVVNGRATVSVSDLKAGTYDVVAKYSGDNNYNAAVATSSFTVSKVDSTMDVTVNDIVFGGDLTVDAVLPDDATGEVIITVDGTSYTAGINDGKATQVVKDLTAGSHVVVVKYVGDDKYTGVEVAENVNVAKAQPVLGVVIADVDYGNGFVIEATLTGVNSAPLNGNVIVTVNGKEYTVKVTDGKGIATGDKLAAGTYAFAAAWAGDDNYNIVTENGDFKVNKIDSSVAVNVNNIKVGEELTITVNVPSDATGDVTVSVDGKEYNVAIENGKAVKTIADLKANDYTVTVKYSGDNNYNAAVAASSFTVSKVDSTMDVTVNDIVFGGDLTVDAVLPDDATGEVVITVNGVDYPVPIVDGKATGTIGGLAAGDYTVTVKYAGDDKYTAVEIAKGVNVAKAQPVLGVVIADVDYGNGFVIEATLTGVNNAPLSGNVIVTVAGKEYIVEVTDGKGIFTGDKLAAGTYGFAAAWAGNDNYNAVVENGDFKVNKIDSTVAVNADDIKVGENVTVTVNVPTDATGDVIIIVDGVDYTVAIENGKAVKTIADLKANDYTVTVKYSGDNNYNANQNTTEFTVSKISDYNMNITVPEFKEGVNSTINVVLPKDATGTVTVEIGGKNYTANVTDGVANVIIPGLGVGDYNITTTYSGDAKYDLMTKKGNITVIPNVDVNLDVDDVVMVYHDGTRLVAKLTDYQGKPIVNATIYFNINGVNYDRTTDANGTASIALNLESGAYPVIVAYNGSASYSKISKNITVTINPSIIADDLVKMYKNDTKFSAKFLGSDGKVLANTTVKFNINGVLYTRTTNNDGVGSLAINLRPGEYVLTAYNPVTGEQQGFNITVKSLIVTQDLTKYYMNASSFQATIYDKNGSLAVGKNVTFNINGVFYTRTADENGVVSLAINLRPGEYIITTIYEELDIGNNVVVLPTLVTSDLNMTYRDGSKFTAQTLDGQGKPLVNQNVTFNVNGRLYFKTTGDDGVASLTINLMSGKYIITSYWNDFQTGNTIIIS